MKTMTCRQLGGACDVKFQANTFDEIAEMSKKHGVEMFKKGDKEHLDAMQKMKELRKTPDEMSEWFESKKKSLILWPKINLTTFKGFLNYCFSTFNGYGRPSQMNEFG